MKYEKLYEAVVNKVLELAGTAEEIAKDQSKVSQEEFMVFYYQLKMLDALGFIEVHLNEETKCLSVRGLDDDEIEARVFGKPEE